MTNHDGVLMGKNLSRDKYLSGAESGFTISDVALGLDLGNHPALGWGLPHWRTEGLIPDVLFRPDQDTFVEWRPGLGSVIADHWTPAGEPIAADPRQALKKIVAAYAERGLSVLASVEIEATVFKTPSTKPGHASTRTWRRSGVAPGQRSYMPSPRTSSSTWMQW